MPFTEKEMDNIDAAAGWKVCHRASPAIDRQSLEAALLDMDYPGRSVSVRNVIDAARKHLETLPKPEPKFRAVAVLSDGTGRINSAHFPRDYVLGLAAKWIHSGLYNSVAVEQVSP